MQNHNLKKKLIYFSNPFQQQVIRCETPTLSARRRSTIFEETLTPDPSVCRWLLDIISEDEHMVKESAHFVQLNIKDEGCCRRFCNDSIQTLNEILIGNVNVLKLDVEKSESDALLDDKLNISDQIDAHSKLEDDALLLLKADKSVIIDAQLKTEDDALLALKLNVFDQIIAYNKTEAEALLDDKLNISDQIVAYIKEKDGVPFLLKADKIELDNYVDLTSTQINYRKCEIFVQANQKVMYLYFVDKQEMDYWQDSTCLRALETELSDMSNVITFFGTATGGSNAITYLSFNGNTIISAKNINFVTTDFDETITGQKTFNTIIHSVEIMKISDDALLLLNADKTYLIDACTKGEANNLYNNKADSEVLYTKGEEDALLLLKADKAQLIDAYSKGETNNLLNNKFDSGVSYTKQEYDAPLLLMVNQTTTYIKIKIEQLQSQIEGDDVDLSDDIVILFVAGGIKPISEFAGIPTDISNYYTKTQTYSKTETNNKYLRLEDQIQQTIAERLKYVSPFDVIYDETQDSVANTYLAMSEIDSKLTNYVKTVNNKEIVDTKKFNANVNATGFVKTGKDDSSILLTDSGDALLSSFVGNEELKKSAFSATLIK
ncbi:MAG: hypothetical protein EZS28_006592 [Streblomastix strix]|uniref:Uncharacterized protein n=1 Tax=Streblomastix strix TaxID=222440 RepID=A0A5J4WUN4_9EUKA|nr:MAG: hypothetical protein EZS28_006592 [Streblomastix strix]